MQSVSRFQNSTEFKINQNNLDVGTGQLGPTLILKEKKREKKKKGRRGEEKPKPNILARLLMQFSESW